jgi:hypothetical protein
MGVWLKPAKKLVRVESMMIHQAMRLVELASVDYKEVILVRVEDARQATYGRDMDAHRIRGAGSVMRDAKIWEDFLTSLGVDFEMVRPRKEFTKFTAKKFKSMTGYEGTTNEHGRDAAMLVYGY